MLNYMLKNENVLLKHYTMPEGETPRKFLLKVSNRSNDQVKGDEWFIKNSSNLYKTNMFYVTKMLKCMFCHNLLEIKRHIDLKLHDDVLGSSTVTLFTKFCRSCILTYYPGYCENYKEQKRYFYPCWKTYGIFVSTHCTAFSIDLLERLITLKQKCHTTFIGRTESFNLQHGYKGGDRQAMDKRRLKKAYFKYTFLLYKERYDLPLNICGNIDEALDREFLSMYEKFQQNYSKHTCEIMGCNNCLVIDGNMKAHRKICKANGCEFDPKHQSLFCKEHSKIKPRIVSEDNKQELIEEDEFHIEHIVKKQIRKKGKCLYEVAWKGFAEHTMEPRENIPRIMVELFERYGSSEAQIEILETKTVNGIEYITVSCREETFTLPACSLQVSENAYFMKNIDEHSCNTEKTKSRFYHRTGGILVMAKPCGIIVSLDEIFGAESVSQVAEVIESYLENCGYEPQCIVYDDACHVGKS